VLRLLDWRGCELRLGWTVDSRTYPGGVSRDVIRVTERRAASQSDARICAVGVDLGGRPDRRGRLSGPRL